MGNKISPSDFQRLISGSPTQVTNNVHLQIQKLEQYFRSAIDWWLHPELLNKLDLSVPDGNQIPESPGTCMILLAVKTDRPHFLAQAFPYPVCWQEVTNSADAIHSRFLPEKLRSLAYQVCQDLRDVPELANRQFRLVPHPETDFHDVDLSAMDECLSWDSGWASLIGGLYLLAYGQRTDRTVWASAARAPKGLQDVTSAQVKMEAVARWGGQAFFIRTRDEYESPEGLMVTELSYHQESVLDRLTPYLQRLAAPPLDSEQGEEALIRHANFFRLRGRQNAEAHYLQHLVGRIGVKCRQKLAKQWGQQSPLELVCILPPRPSPVALAIESTGVKRVTLLVDELQWNLPTESQHPENTLQDTLEQLKKRFKQRISFDFKLIRLQSREVELPQVKQALEEIFARRKPGEVVIDLTPGYRGLAFWLLELARPGDWLINCRSDTDERDRPKPETSDYSMWKKADTSCL